MPNSETSANRKTAVFSQKKTQSEIVKQPVIVQILPALNLGGVERGTVEMARAIIAEGGKAVVISSGGHLVSQLQRIGAEHITLPVHVKNPLKWPSVRSKVKQALKSCGADLVHVRSRAPAWIALPAAKSLGLPTIATIHGKFRAKSVIKKIYNRKMLSADKVIAISYYVRDLITSQFQMPDLERKLSVIHRGVDVSQFDPAKVTQGRIINEAQRLDLLDGRAVIMMPARPTIWKGHKILLEAVSKLVAQNQTEEPSFQLVFLGVAPNDGKLYSALEQRIKSLGLESIVRLAERSSDMPASLMLADVVVMPSILPEPFGRVAIEAQAMGRPVVAFAHGGAVESIEDDITGFLATPSDSDALAEALQKAIALGPRKRKAFAVNARAHIQAEFTTDIMCQKTITLYQKLLSSET